MGRFPSLPRFYRCGGTLANGCNTTANPRPLLTQVANRASDQDSISLLTHQDVPAKVSWLVFCSPRPGVWNRSDRRVPGGSTIRVVVTTPKIIASRFPLTRNVRSPKLPTVRHTARLPQGQRASPGELSQRRSNSFGRNELALVVSRPGGITDVHGAVAKWLRQRIANPPSSVRIRSAPLWKAKVLRAQTAVSWLFSCPSETWIGAGGTVSVPNTPLCHPPQPEQLVNPAKPVSNAGWKRAHSAQSDLHFLGRTSSNGTIGRVLSSHLLTTRNP
jgi:hypothetical protein